jgi:hypothetical protein
MNRVTVAVLATFVVLLLGCGLLAYVLRDETNAVAPRPSIRRNGRYLCSEKFLVRMRRASRRRT